MFQESRAIELFLFSFFALMPIVNPIGMSSFFLQITENYSKKERKQLAFSVAKYSILLLVVVLLTGASILRFFGISLDFIRVSGGLLVAWSAWRSLNNTSPTGKEEPKAPPTDDNRLFNIAFFPLTMPLTAGPGAIAVTIAMETRIEDKFSLTGIFQYLGLLCGIGLTGFFIWLCYAFAEDIFHVIGKTGTKAITSLTSMIILTIGVSIFWQGLSALLTQLLMTTGHK